MKFLNIVKQIVVISMATLVSSSAFAAQSGGSGSSLPFESWIVNLQQSLTGPVATAISVVGLVGSGVSLIFTGGEINRFLRTIIYLALVISLIIGANSWMNSFFNGATL